MNLKALAVVLISCLLLSGCFAIIGCAPAYGEVVLSTRAASYQPTISIVAPPIGPTGTLLHGTTLLMLLQVPKNVKETWHYGKAPTRTKLTSHTVNCYWEEEKYTDGSMGHKQVKP